MFWPAIKKLYKKEKTFQDLKEQVFVFVFIFLTLTSIVDKLDMLTDSSC